MPLREAGGTGVVVTKTIELSACHGGHATCRAMHTRRDASLGDASFGPSADIGRRGQARSGGEGHRACGDVNRHAR